MTRGRHAHRALVEFAAREPDDACWVWPYAKATDGYGVASINGRMVLVHRWSYETFVGEIPAGMQLDHLCRNPACLNPTHLEPVTVRENTLRGVGPTARNARKDRCPKCGGPFTPGHGGRECHPCRLAWIRAWKRSRKLP